MESHFNIRDIFSPFHFTLLFQGLALCGDDSVEAFGLALTLGRLHGEDRQFKQAIPYYLRALDLFPTAASSSSPATPRAAVTQALGRQLLGDGQCQSALRFFELGQSEVVDPQHVGLKAELLFHASLAAWIMRDIDGASAKIDDLLSSGTKGLPSSVKIQAQRLLVEMSRTLYDFPTLETQLKTLIRGLRREMGTTSDKLRRLELESSLREAHYLAAEGSLAMHEPYAAMKAIRVAEKVCESMPAPSKAEELLVRVRNNSVVAGCLTLLGEGDRARTILRRDWDSLSENNGPPTALSGRVKADVIHRLALSWVYEGNKAAALPLWRGVIETVSEVEESDASMIDQVRHARALVISCIHASKTNNVVTISSEEEAASSGSSPSGSVEAEAENAMRPEVRKLVEKRLDDLESLDEAKKSLQEALESEVMYHRVFKARLESPKITFESLWPGLVDRF